jgi:2-enoate reductase
VKLNTAVTDIESLGADEVVIATGSTPNRIPVKGVERSIQAIDFLLGKAEVGQNVTIIGGGLTGCEIAYELFLQGKNPTIVEMKEDLIDVPGVCLANTSFLRDFFKANNVAVHLETGVKEIGESSVTAAKKDGTLVEIPADSVILSVGYRSAPLAEKARHVHLVGDCSKVGNLRTVIWQAWDVCMKL